MSNNKITLNIDLDEPASPLYPSHPRNETRGLLHVFHPSLECFPIISRSVFAQIIYGLSMYLLFRYGPRLVRQRYLSLVLYVLVKSKFVFRFYLFIYLFIYLLLCFFVYFVFHFPFCSFCATFCFLHSMSCNFALVSLVFKFTHFCKSHTSVSCNVFPLLLRCLRKRREVVLEQTVIQA